MDGLSSRRARASPKEDHLWKRAKGKGQKKAHVHALKSRPKSTKHLLCASSPPLGSTDNLARADVSGCVTA